MTFSVVLFVFICLCLLETSRGFSIGAGGGARGIIRAVAMRGPVRSGSWGKDKTDSKRANNTEVKQKRAYDRKNECLYANNIFGNSCPNYYLSYKSYHQDSREKNLWEFYRRKCLFELDDMTFRECFGYLLFFLSATILFGYIIFGENEKGQKDQRSIFGTEKFGHE